MKTRSGLSLAEIQKRTRPGTSAERELTRSTISSVLRGDRKPQRPVLESLLIALDEPPEQREQILEMWEALSAVSQDQDSALPCFADMSPRELGVHAAIQSGDSPDELPGYVPRHFDPDLRSFIRNGVDRGCFVVLIGRSSTGKTRSLYEAVRAVVPQWWLVQPSTTEEIYRLLEERTERTVVWLDEMYRFFDSSPPLTKALIVKLRNAGLIVVGTIWFDDFRARTTGMAARHAPESGLLECADQIDVAQTLRDVERRAAETLASTDSRIRAALQVKDAELTQALAAGPELIRSWSHAPPYARAAMTAAADARRLGILTPLPSDLLVDAMAGYLTPAERVAPPSYWLREVESYAEPPVHETVAALSKVAGRRAGTSAGYVAADYLAQHLHHERRTECPPGALWEALIDRLENAEDIRRLRDAAASRMRYRLQERALRRLSEAGDEQASAELAWLLARQDRLDAAVAVLVGWAEKRPTDEEAAAALDDMRSLLARARPLRNTDRRSRLRLAELLYDRGESEDLRTKAEQGDATAADELALLMADRGMLTELRERADGGHRLALDLLAELLAGHRRTDELAARAAAGDHAAELWLGKLQNSDQESVDAVEAIRESRESLAAREPHAAERLTSLLFDLRHEEALRVEVDAGTQFAADRLLALLMAARSDDEAATDDVLRLRAFGMHADGTLASTEGHDHG
ncbi:hypothetical protein [Actinoplanes sp. NPDC023714]|uniref:hypothetical protein n=1 Tax=Actinoplanes sp. NPDC023714 TaxID=3154322 RepID=UPI0033C81311